MQITFLYVFDNKKPELDEAIFKEKVRELEAEIRDIVAAISELKLKPTDIDVYVLPTVPLQVPAPTGEVSVFVQQIYYRPSPKLSEKLAKTILSVAKKFASEYLANCHLVEVFVQHDNRTIAKAEAILP